MGNFYYFIGLILFLANIGLLSKFRRIAKIREWVSAFTNVTKKKPTKGDFKDKEYEELAGSNLILALNFFWLFFGLISKSWIIFLILLSFNFIINITSKIFKQFSLASIILNFCKMTIINIGIGVLVINHYHLHLNLIHYFIPQW